MRQWNDIFSQLENKDVARSTHLSSTRFSPMLPLTAVIAKNVKRHRIERDFSLAALAKKANISLNDLFAIENAHMRPEPEQLLALAKTFDILPSVLLADE
ncbi:helix-turn-helix domain-containing protein [Gluconobacter oxydans]|uniref:helix-turn-helix domain-containing protein n=2 Tax=Gluconobacter oxydans TaxID=442 RepID=UPI00343B53EA